MRAIKPWFGMKFNRQDSDTAI